MFPIPGSRLLNFEDSPILGRPVQIWTDLHHFFVEQMCLVNGKNDHLPLAERVSQICPPLFALPCPLWRVRRCAARASSAGNWAAVAGVIKRPGALCPRLFASISAVNLAAAPGIDDIDHKFAVIHSVEDPIRADPEPE